MNDFMEKYNNDTKFKAAIKLGIYTFFVIIVAVFAFSNQEKIEETNEEDNNNEEIIEETTKEIEYDKLEDIELSETYEIKITINLDDNYTTYNINKTLEETTITKENLETTKEYILKDNNYYLNNNENYILTNKKEVYDIIDYNYLDLNTIKEYSKKATMNDNNYIIYLKDIILNNTSEKYINITYINNIINIDYTELMKAQNIANEKCNISIEIKNKEE